MQNVDSIFKPFFLFNWGRSLVTLRVLNWSKPFPLIFRGFSNLHCFCLVNVQEDVYSNFVGHMAYHARALCNICLVHCVPSSAFFSMLLLFPKLVCLELTYCVILDLSEWLEFGIPLKAVTCLDFSHSRLVGDHVISSRMFPNLKFVCFKDTNISDKSLRKTVKECSASLQKVSFMDCKHVKKGTANYLRSLYPNLGIEC